MDQIEITPATPEERPWAGRLMFVSEPWVTLRITSEQCLKASQDPDYLLYVARSQHAPIGCILVHPRGVAGSPYIKSIAVAEAYRGRGVGAELVRFAEEMFRPKARHLFLCVSSFNTRARKLYERLGYKKAGEFKDYIVQGYSEVLMHKRL